MEIFRVGVRGRRRNLDVSATYELGSNHFGLIGEQRRFYEAQP